MYVYIHKHMYFHICMSIFIDIYIHVTYKYL